MQSERPGRVKSGLHYSCHSAKARREILQGAIDLSLFNLAYGGQLGLGFAEQFSTR